MTQRTKSTPMGSTQNIDFINRNKFCYLLLFALSFKILFKKSCLVGSTIAQCQTEADQHVVVFQGEDCLHCPV